MWKRHTWSCSDDEWTHGWVWFEVACKVSRVARGEPAFDHSASWVRGKRWKQRPRDKTFICLKWGHMSVLNSAQLIKVQCTVETRILVFTSIVFTWGWIFPLVKNHKIVQDLHVSQFYTFQTFCMSAEALGAVDRLTPAPLLLARSLPPPFAVFNSFSQPLTFSPAFNSFPSPTCPPVQQSLAPFHCSGIFWALKQGMWQHGLQHCAPPHQNHHPCYQCHSHDC